MSDGMADRFRQRQTENPSWRDAVRGGPEQPPAAPREGETVEQFHAAQQTQLLGKIAGDISTLRGIAVFFTVLWSIGAVIVLISVFGNS